MHRNIAGHSIVTSTRNHELIVGKKKECERIFTEKKKVYRSNRMNFLHCLLQNGNTPLHLACQNNEVETVEILINKGVDLNCLNLVCKKRELHLVYS